MLCVDGRSPRQGPLVNTAVISNAAPSYAPAGRHLIQASAVIEAGRPVPAEPEMRRHAAEILGGSAAGWELLRSGDEVRDVRRVGGRGFVRPVRLGADHLDVRLSALRQRQQ